MGQLGEELLSLGDFQAEFGSKNEKETIIRLNLTSKEDSLKWIEEYKEVTGTGLIVKDTMSANPTRYVFHKKWACQLSNQNKKGESKRNQKCPVLIDILVKKLTKDTKKNDPYLRRDKPLQGVIIVKGSHSHRIDNYEALNFLRIAETTKEEFNNYFNNGHGPADAIHTHEAKLMMEGNYETRLCNASINPKQRTVYHLYRTWVQSEYGLAWSATTPLQKLKEKIKEYRKDGTEINVEETDDGKWCALIVTPIMRRAHSLNDASEIIFTDSTGSCDAEGNILTLILTATKGGAVPLCAMIHNRKDTASYTQAYSMLAKFYPKCYGGQSAPQVFMTDDCSAEKAALAAVWPDAEHYLCHFHVCQAEWRWLCEKKNEVPDQKRQHCMGLFQKMLYAIETQEYEEAKENFKESCCHEGYKERVTKFLSREREWAKIFRSETLNRGHNTDNFSEASIGVIKDIVLGRTKAYNSCALTDYLVRVWEEHIKRRLLHYAYDRESKPRLLFNKLCDRMPEDAADQIQDLGDELYFVPSAEKDGLFYEVNSSIGWCNCPAGKCGRFCKHQALVFSKYGKGFPNKPAITSKERHRLAMIALGKEQCPQINFFRGFKDGDEDDDEEHMDLSDSIYTNEERETEESGENEQQEISDSKDNAEIMELDELIGELKEQIERLHELGKEQPGDTYHKSLQTLIRSLKKPQTPEQVIGLFLQLKYASLKVGNRRRSMIHVQPGAIQRRKEGKSKGTKRLRAGRPPAAEPKRASKPLPHQLSLSLRANKSHVKNHSRK